MRKQIAPLLALSLTGCWQVPPPSSGPPGGYSGGGDKYSPTGAGLGPAASYLAPDYAASFLDGDNLGCAGCITRDVFHSTAEALVEGRSNLGETANWTKAADGALEMVLTAPALSDTPKDAAGNPETASMGIFSTGRNFGQGTKFSVSATFKNPSDTVGSPGWGVGVVARTGDRDDTPDLKRLQLTLRFCSTDAGKCRPTRANLRIQEISGPAESEFHQLASVDIPWYTYDQIVDNKISPPPFTLKLLVDRQSGSVQGIMTAGTQTFALGPVDTTYFTQNNGEAFTTVGAALANCCDPGKRRSVDVTHFEIWAH